MVKEINEKNFKEEVLESKEKVLVDFWAPWCGPCRMVGPITEELSETHKVCKVNVDDEEDLAREYNVTSIPCLILFENGKETKRSIGLKPKEELEKLFD